MKSELKKHKLKELANAYTSRDLRINPEFQRGTIWRPPQKQALIDSLLRGYQIPLFYVHLKETANAFTGGINTTVWLVDGQQRLAAIADFLKNEFSLPDSDGETQKAVSPTLLLALAPWRGKKFEQLDVEDRDRLLNRELLVIEMREDEGNHNEVRDLFIRLQAGTPLTAQEKRDAWPGDFTTFVIRHAGKPDHPANNPKPFFQIVPRGATLNIDDGDHYVDRLAARRKFFAGLAMTIMHRERSGSDFVDLKGKTINDFYMGNLELKDEDPAVIRVIKTLDAVPLLPGFEQLLTRRPVSHQMAFHLALLIDSLVSGDYVPVWRNDILKAFVAFQEELTKARLNHKRTHQPTPHYERFIALLSGSGSDTADLIRRRHAFFLEKMYPAIKIKPRDGKRLFDTLDKEWIWIRDKQTCQSCKQPVTFINATVHHVIEHTAGGDTIVENGVVVCHECHADRKKMQELTPMFQEYLQQQGTLAATSGAQ
jgi:hypothetical protein